MLYVRNIPSTNKYMNNSNAHIYEVLMFDIEMTKHMYPERDRNLDIYV